MIENLDLVSFQTFPVKTIFFFSKNLHLAILDILMFVEKTTPSLFDCFWTSDFICSIKKTNDPIQPTKNWSLTNGQTYRLMGVNSEDPAVKVGAEMCNRNAVIYLQNALINLHESF